MATVLLYGDSERSPALRHEVPVAISDPFLYAEVDGSPRLVIGSLDAAVAAAARPDAELVDLEELGFGELRESGTPREQVMLELVARAVARFGISEATVDPEFPLAVADRLRADGVTLRPDHQTFALRRRVKSGAELEGIGRAQRAAEAAMGAAAELLRGATVRGDEIVAGGEPLLAETIRARIREVCAEHGAPAPPDIMVVSVRQGFGHVAGSGPLPAHLPIQVDLWPRDEPTGCWADMTRTFVVGEVSETVRAQEELVTEALRQVKAAVKPGVTGRELHAIACEPFEAAGWPTQRTAPGRDPSEGFRFSLGHGIGLEVHEDPGLGQSGWAPLLAGDVIALEPGLWDPDIGGVRFEDLVLVTETGCTTLTGFPYSLTP